MKINKIKIDGFKNVSDTILELNGITALVGLNNYGKSNILEAINFAKNFIKNPYQIKSAMMAYARAIPINIETVSKNFSFEMEYTTKFNNKKVFIDYSFSFHWLDANKISRIENEMLKIKYCSKGQRYSKIVSRDSSGSFYQTSPTGRCDKPIKIEDDNLIINKISNFDDLFYLDIIKELNNVSFDLNIFLDTSKSFDFLPIQMKNDDIYSLDKSTGNNIAQIVYNLKKDYPDKYELIINSFMSLFPNIESIEPQMFLLDKNKLKVKEIDDIDDAPFMIADNIFNIVVKERYNVKPENFENLSNGTKRIFILLTSAILADIHKIELIAFEELENCIHPVLFQQLLTILSNIAENIQIIVTSHSPYLIQYLDLDNIYIGVPSRNGTAKFKKIKKNKQSVIMKNARDYNVSIGDYIFEMLVDSFNDDNELSSYLECDI